MKHTCIATIATMLLALGMVDAVSAEPYGRLPARTDVPKSPEERRAQATMEMDAWLRRLVGRYYQFERITIDGTLKNHFVDGERPDGTVATRFVDCVGIGSGPGVLCTWYSVVHRPGREVSYRFSMLVEFGLDPNASKIRVLMVVGEDLIGESSAELIGDTASWLGMSCNSTPVELIDCQRTLKISAPADGKYLVWDYGSRFAVYLGQALSSGPSGVYLYRLSPDEGNGPDGLPRTMAAPRLDIEVDRRARPTGPR